MKKLGRFIVNGLWITFLVTVLAGSALFVAALRTSGASHSWLILWP